MRSSVTGEWLMSIARSPSTSRYLRIRQLKACCSTTTSYSWHWPPVIENVLSTTTLGGESPWSRVSPISTVGGQTLKRLGVAEAPRPRSEAWAFVHQSKRVLNLAPSPFGKYDWANVQLLKY